MWTTSRSRTIALGAALAATAVTGCGIDSGPPRLRTGGPTGQPTTSLVSRPPPGPGGSLPSIGLLPAPVEGGPAATLRTCEVDPKDPSVAVVEAVVVNTSSSPKMMQGLAVTVRDGSGAVVSSDGSDLGHRRLSGRALSGNGRNRLRRPPVLRTWSRATERG